MRRMTLCAVVLTVFLFLFTSTLFAGSSQVPKTGQTKCYNTAGAEVSCPNTGQDGEFKAGAAWPVPRFTVRTGAGSDCITDNLTGLMWAKNANAYKIDPNATDGDCTDWVTALAFAQNTFEACGYTDWRLPNINELESLTNKAFGEGDPLTPGLADWLMDQGFVNVIRGSYLSSTTYEGDPVAAWMMGLDNTIASGSKIDCNWVWPVRTGGQGTISLPRTGQVKCFDMDGNELLGCSGTGQDGDILAGVTPPASRFAYSGECVTDLLTGLTWAKAPDTTLRNWQAALDHANGLTLCNYGDWRLPNIKELRSLVDYGQIAPAFPFPHSFENVQSYVYWSSTTDPFNPMDAWGVHFYWGDVLRIDAKDFALTWPVRFGAIQIEGISVTPSSKNFGTVAPGGTSPAQVFTVAYVGSGSVTVNSVSLGGTNANQFQKVSGSDQCMAGQVLNSGDHCTVQALFSPTSTGAKTADLTIASTSGTTPTLVATLKGTGGTPGGAGTIELPQTGQTTCYNTDPLTIYASAPCTGTAQDGDYQAGVPWPPPRFEGGTGAESDCIVDHLTGLMWGRSASPAVTWAQAADFAKNLDRCGHGDWRVPNINELESLLNWDTHQQISIWLNAQGFVGIEPTIPWPDDFEGHPAYWTSTYYPWHDGSTFYGVWMSTGLWHPWGRASELRVLPVRLSTTGAVRLPQTGQTKCLDEDGKEIPCAGTGQDAESRAGVAWPVSRFSDHGDGRVTDRLTGLMWTKDAYVPGPPACTPGETKLWDEAVAYLACLNSNGYLGHSDWRFPNRNEMRSLVDYSQSNPVLSPGHPFVNPLTDDDSYWSSTVSSNLFTALYDWNGGVRHEMSVWLGIFDTDAIIGGIHKIWPVRTAEPVGYTLSVTKTGTGSGSVTSTNPAGGIDCGSDCSESYPSGTAVTLSASATTGSTFTGWSAAGCPGTGTCTVTMNADTAVEATFALNQYQLTVTMDGNGGGLVWVEFGTDLSWVGKVGTATYDYNTVVTLHALAILSTFTGWSGEGCSGTGTCTVTMDRARNVTATFVLDQVNFTLTVTKAGTGSGTVTSTNPPGGIDCGSDCSENYAPGTVVTLSAAAAAGSLFKDWSGACTGTGPCQVTMSEARGVTATFDTVPAGPYITDIMPSPFGLGVSLTIRGGHFGTTKPTVFFGTTKAKVTSYKADEIVCSLLKGAAGVYPVRVVVKKVGESAPYNVELHAPVIDSTSVQAGIVGAPVTINGRYFGAKKPKVYLVQGTTAKAAKVSTYSDTQLLITVPKVKVTGAYVIKVTNGAGTSNEYPFTVN